MKLFCLLVNVAGKNPINRHEPKIPPTIWLTDDWSA